MVDIGAIGAGGSSIAWLDEAGLLKVGSAKRRRSARTRGLVRGGTEATITDAQIMLQRLNPQTLLKEKMPVYAEPAWQVSDQKVAQPLVFRARWRRKASSASPLPT